MSATALATMNESALTVLPPAQRPADAAMAMLQSHAEMMDMAYGLARKMCETKLVPTRFFKKPDDATAAILYGMELGLSPIQSLQRVIPIHGMPTLEALTMVALIEPHGYTVKTVLETDTVCEVHGWKPGRNPDVDDPDATSRWTIERAMKAGYVPRPASPDSLCRPEVDDDWVTVTKMWDGKAKKSVVGNMKYITDPQAMLVAKGRTKVCKEMAPHILLGLAGSTEDLLSERSDDDDDEPRRRTVTSTRGDALTVDEVVGGDVKSGGGGLASKIKPAQVPTDELSPPVEAATVPADEITPSQPEAASKTRRSRSRKDRETAESGEATEVTQEETRDGAGDTNEVESQVENTTADPDPGPQPAESAKPAKTAMRRAVEKRLFAMVNDLHEQIGDKEPISRDERLGIYRTVLKRSDITSTDDLDNPEVAAVADQLFQWGQSGDLAEKITEIRDLAAVDAAAAADMGES